MDSDSTDKNKRIIAIIGLVVIVAAIAVGASIYASKNAGKTAAIPAASPSSSPSTLDASTTPTPTATLAASPEATAAYKDGTYQATGGYDSPGGDESVNLSVTLANGVVTNSTVTTSASNPTGARYQSLFVEGYKSFVTGKNISDIHLSKVSGSSLTSSGFNNALEQIKTQAKS